MKIKTKKLFYELYEAGLLGNRPQMWSSIDAFRKSGHGGLLGVRSLTPGRPCIYYVPDAELESAVAKTVGGYNLSPMHNDDEIILQGELVRLEGVLHLHYSTQPLPMRLALKKEAKNASGLKALMLLRSAAWPQSVSEIEELQDAYPDAVIEFSCYQSSVGIYPNRNTIIWEVRNY